MGSRTLIRSLFSVASFILPWVAQAYPRPPADDLQAGRILIAQGNYTDAQTRLLAAIQQPQSEALASAELAGLYQLLGDYLQAETYYLRAERTWQSTRAADNSGLVRILNNLTTLYLNTGQTGKSQRACVRTAIVSRLAPELEPPDRARLLGNFAAMYAAQRRYDAAVLSYSEAEALWEESMGPESLEAASVLSNLGVIAMKMQKPSDATLYLERSVAIWRKQAGPGPGLVIQLAALAEAYLSTGRLQNAEQAFNEALSDDSRFSPLSKRCLPRLLTSYAGLLRRTKRPVEAKELEKQAKALLRESPGSPAYTVDVGELRRPK